MDELGFVTPDYPRERRVALLPEHARPGWVIERGYGATLGIPDSEYETAGCRVTSRAGVYASCDVIVNLKLTPERDYPLLDERHVLVGWTHPTGSGAGFYRGVAAPLGLVIIDLDNAYPTAYRRDSRYRLPIPRDFVWRNSWLAGWCSALHALQAHGVTTPDRAAVLGAGNVSQGALTALSRLGTDCRVFTRRTMPAFHPWEWSVVVNGVETDAGPLITTPMQDDAAGVLFIDAAADPNTIEGSTFTTWDAPIREWRGNYYYCINNTPTLAYREASRVISAAFSRHAYTLDHQAIRAALS
jgi:N5-(carboxyethyl)ornithine synthase